jgi:hypothetical protein
MTLAGFKTCKQRDFENGAVQNEIYESIKRMEKMETGIEGLIAEIDEANNKTQSDRDYAMAEVADKLRAIRSKK